MGPALSNSGNSYYNTNITWFNFPFLTTCGQAPQNFTILLLQTKEKARHSARTPNKLSDVIQSFTVKFFPVTGNHRERGRNTAHSVIMCGNARTSTNRWWGTIHLKSHCPQARSEPILGLGGGSGEARWWLVRGSDWGSRPRKGELIHYTSRTPGSSTGLRSTLINHSYCSLSGIRSCLPAIATMHDVHGELAGWSKSSVLFASLVAGWTLKCENWEVEEKRFGGVVCWRGRSVNASYATQEWWRSISRRGLAIWQ